MSRKGKNRAPIERVSGLESENDRRGAIDVLAAAFRKTTRPQVEINTRKAMWNGPIFDPEHTRIVVADGRVVSVVVMAPRMIRFGPVAVPAMTVGGVATHPDYQMLGYNAVCMNDCTRYMKEHEFLLAYLGGFRKYYHKFGYYPYGATGGVTLYAGESRRQGLPGRLRPMTGKDIPRVARLYDKATKGYICTAVRDKAVWEWLISCGVHGRWFEDARVILDDRDRPVGYLTMQGKKGLNIRELIVLQDERSWRVALRSMGQLARRRGLTQYTIPVHWGHPMSVYLRQYFQTWNSLETKPDGGRLLAIIDFPVLMQKIEPLLTERLRAAKLAARNVRFTLESEIGSVCITAARDRIKVGGPSRGTRVRVGVRWLSGLLTGYYVVRDIEAREGVRIPRAMVPVMNALFPRGWPIALWADHY